MSPGIRYLTRPESLPESALLEIIKTRIIELPKNSKTLKKSDLVEIFKRVALPLPQRQYNEAKCFGRRLSELRLLRKIPTAIEEDKKLFESTVSSQIKSDDKTSECERLNLSSSNSSSASSSPEKQTQSTNWSPGSNGVSENSLKRKVNDNEVSAQTGVRKRHKITWP